MVIKSVYISLNQCVWLLTHTTYAHIGVNNIISCYDDTVQATQQTSAKAKFELQDWVKSFFHFCSSLWCCVSVALNVAKQRSKNWL